MPLHGDHFNPEWIEGVTQESVHAHIHKSNYIIMTTSFLPSNGVIIVIVSRIAPVDTII